VTAHVSPGRRVRPGQPDDRLCGAILRFYAVLAEEITKALDLVAQGRKAQASRRPFLLAGGLLVQQSPFPVAQRRRVLEVLCVKG